MRIILLTTCFCFFIPVLSRSQEKDNGDYDWEEILESVVSLQNDEANQDEINNSLNQMHENPLDLNTAGPDDFNILFFLTEAQIDSLIQYRSLHGSFLSVRELNYINGIDPHTARLLSAFVTVGDIERNKKKGIANWLPYGRKSILTKYFSYLEKPAGYLAAQSKTPDYLGWQPRILNQFKLTVPDEVSMGLTMEKDPGEPMIWSPSNKYYGFDHYSGHFALLNSGHLKNLTLGDYKLQYGQGLVLGNAFYLGKSAETIATIDNKASGIRPYCGAGESGVFTGIAMDYKIAGFEISGFFSGTQADGRLDTISGTHEMVIRSLNTTGLHRTITEIENRKNIKVMAAGGHINYSDPRLNLTLGTTFVYTRFSLPFREESNYYNHFDFQGRNLLTGGIDYRYFHRKFSLFGEVASCGINSVGLINGCMVNISKNIETALSIRYYSPLFHTLYGSPLREASSVVNESGIYWGLKIIPLKRIFCNFYIDSFRFPWLKYNVKSPSSGEEILVKLSWEAGRFLEIYGQFLEKQSMITTGPTGRGIDELALITRHQYWMQASYLAESGIQLKTRIQFSDYKEEGTRTRGVAAFQDIGWKISSLSFHTRFEWFNTDDYLNRQYIYEQGALYDYQVPSYAGRGARIYFMLSGKVGNHFRYWLKSGRTIYKGVTSIGTGTETIGGNQKTGLLAQIEIIF